MSLANLLRLVSQAESERVTLASVLSREMSVKELKLAQQELAACLVDNYARIENFMAGVEVTSLEEILRSQDSGTPDAGIDSIGDLSDVTKTDEERA